VKSVALGRARLCRCRLALARSWRHNDRRIRMTLADLTVGHVPMYAPSPGNDATGPQICSRKGRPESSNRHPCGQRGGESVPCRRATTRRISLQDRRVLRRAFSTKPPPGTAEAEPVPSTSSGRFDAGRVATPAMPRRRRLMVNGRRREIREPSSRSTMRQVFACLAQAPEGDTPAASRRRDRQGE